MLVRLRRALLTPMCAALVASVMLFMSCQNGGEQALAPEYSYDGETLYRGLIQGRGPVAELIPEVRDNFVLDDYVSGEALDTLLVVHDRIVETIHMIEPEFFDGLKAAMESGDHLRIQAKIREAESVTLRSVLSWQEIKPEFLQMSRDRETVHAVTTAINSKLPANQHWEERDVRELLREMSVASVVSMDAIPQLAIALAIIIFVLVWLAIATDFAIFTDFYFWVHIYVWIDPKDEPRDPLGSPLLEERLIDSIVQKLSRVGEGDPTEAGR